MQTAVRQRVNTCGVSHTSKATRVRPAVLVRGIGDAAAAVVVTTAAAMVLTSSAIAGDLPIESVFAAKCAGCHMNGGNVVQAGATLFAEDLKKNGISDPDALYNIIYAGKGKMPGYGTDCAPKGKCTFGPRLSDDDVRALASFVQERAAASWK